MADTTKPVAQMTKREAMQYYTAPLLQESNFKERLELALEGTQENPTSWIRAAADYIGLNVQNWTGARVERATLLWTVIKVARLGMLPGFHCELIAYKAKGPGTVQYQISADGWRALTARSPGIVLVQGMAVHKKDHYKPPAFRRDAEGRPCLDPEFESKGFLFDSYADVQAVLGIVKVDGDPQLFHINQRDLNKSRASSKDTARALFKTDPEAWARVVWMRRACEHFGVSDQARMGLRMMAHEDEPEVEGDLEEEATPEADTSQAQAPAEDKPKAAPTRRKKAADKAAPADKAEQPKEEEPPPPPEAEDPPPPPEEEEEEENLPPEADEADDGAW